MAPEAVWQVGRPPYQSEIWYGGAMPIRDAGISLVLIPKTRYSITFLILLLYQLLLLIDIFIQHTYLLTDYAQAVVESALLTLCDCQTDLVQAVLHLLE